MQNEMTIGRVIDAFRELLRQVSDDSKYTDEYLYYVLTISRAKILKDSIDKNREISPWLYQRFCVKLCPSTFIECNCEPFDFGCTIYRSEKPIPKPLWTGYSSIINVSELWGDSILPMRETSVRVMKHRKYKHKMYYLIGDLNGEKYLYVITTVTPPRFIKIEGVFDDPSLVEDVACKEDCPSPQGTGFPLDIAKHYDLIKLALDYMGISLKLNEDLSNNSNSSNKEIII